MELRLGLSELRWIGISFVFVSLSIFFSYAIFPSQTSLLSISFLVIALTPLLYSAMEREEAIVAHENLPFVKKYGGMIAIILLISAGIFFAYAFWYNVLPSDPGCKETCSTALPCKEAVFSAQLGYISQERGLDKLFSLMLICFILSLFLGAGAILIISWDLSILVIGSEIAHLSFVLYLPQLLAFFLTGLAGVLLSFAIVKHEWRGKAFFVVAKDSMILLAFALVLTPLSYFLLPRL